MPLVGAKLGGTKLFGAEVVASPEGFDEGGCLVGTDDGGCSSVVGTDDSEGAEVGALGELEGAVVDGELDGEAEGMLVVAERHVVFAS